MAWGRPPSSSGLGRRPFKAVARVRIPLGARHRHICARRGVRSSSPPCQGGDRGIEARRARWVSESGTARSPVWGSKSERSPQTRSGEVAQSVEHAAENRGVGGSIPPLPTQDRPLVGKTEATTKTTAGTGTTRSAAGLYRHDQRRERDQRPVNDGTGGCPRSGASSHLSGAPTSAGRSVPAGSSRPAAPTGHLAHPASRNASHPRSWPGGSRGSPARSWRSCG